MSAVLVDSSVWIDFFRGERRAVVAVDALLEADQAASCGAVLAEVTSRAPSTTSFRDLRHKLAAIPRLADPPGLWDEVASARFALARQGIQAHLIDLVIALTAAHGDHRLLTRDRDFVAIARVVPVDVEFLGPAR